MFGAKLRFNLEIAKKNEIIFLSIQDCLPHLPHTETELFPKICENRTMNQKLD